MKILVTGRGGAASWTVRGEQIGAALGAVVKPHATLADMKAADVVLVVKRVPPEMLDALRRCGRPWVYDVVDAYPQREATYWTRSASISWLRAHIAHLAPASVIWPNATMMRDAELGGTTIYHHFRPGMAKNPIRDRLQVVGYEGHPRYIEGMVDRLTQVCWKRGAVLVVNPKSLADVDVVLALRGREWDSYAAKNWKSNIKLANAHGSGTPFIGAPEAGYQETAAGCEYWAERSGEVGLALDWLEAKEARQTVSERFLAMAIPIERAAAQTRAVLALALSPCASKS